MAPSGLEIPQRGRVWSFKIDLDGVFTMPRTIYIYSMLGVKGKTEANEAATSF
jgi:hypothetical protein